MTDEFGPWELASVEHVTQVFTGAPFRWWLTGCVALELFIGHSWRAHDDIDIGICRIDATAAHKWLVELEPYIAVAGSLRRWVGEPLSAERAEDNVWVKRPDGPFLFDIQIGDGDDSGWIYRRDPGIRRP